MAALTAQAIANTENTDRMTLLKSQAARFSTLSRLTAQDEGMLRIMEKQQKEAERSYKAVLERIRKNEEKQVYVSLQGGDMGLMKHLKEEEKENETVLATTVNRMAILKKKVAAARAQVKALETQKQALLAQMTGMAEGTEASAAPAPTAAVVTTDRGTREALSPAAPAVPMPAEEPLTADQANQPVLARLRAEYAPELERIGYIDEQHAETVAVLEPPEHPVDVGKKFKIDGEIRIDNRSNNNHDTIDPERGRTQFPDDRLRLRARLYLDYNFDDNWHALGMLESEKSLSGDDEMDGSVDLDRYYLQGHIGRILTTAGAFGSTLAEGNIYDSKFKGIMAQYGEKEDPWKLTAQYGEVNEADHVYGFTAAYDRPDYGIDLGGYSFRMDSGSDRQIGMFNYRMPLGGWYHLGAMYLYGHDDEADGGSGYVFTLSRGREDSWSRGNLYAYLKYYYQPEATYVEHTMNGMADYMHGFKGLGFGLSYTVARDWVASLEYDRLEDLKYGHRNNTLWLALSYFFNNYQSDYEE